MDARFNNLGFAANPVSNAFKNLSNSTNGSGTGYYSTDTTLRLDSPGSSSLSLFTASKGIKRKWGLIDEAIPDPQIPLPLCLGLGNSSSSSDSKGSSAATSFTKETTDTEESSMDLELDFSLHLSTSPKKLARSIPKSLDARPTLDLELSLSTGPTESDITTVHPISTQPLNIPLNILKFPLEDSRSFPPLQNSPSSVTSYILNELKAAPLIPERSGSIITTPKSSVTSNSEFTQHRSSSGKTCQFKGCGKGARGASGLCIAHGGGRRCQKPGCHKGAEGRTAYCKAHGGGRRCEFLGCTKSAEGRTDFCIAHGGGRRCSHEGCTRAARGKSGLCIRHGGGKRCQKDNCTKSAEGLSGLCISHGGGRRCQYPECTKGAQGSTMFCKAHGGGKRCTFEGCTKGAEGSTPFCKGHGGGKRCAFKGGGVCPKSVHGGTLFCVAHGGGKRCAVVECTKSARGRTDYCVRHGGGKRCKSEGCSKSAQGSTDFCKAHGGGKRCMWGQPGSEFGKGEGVCNSFARVKTGLCASHGALVQDKRVHGGATLGVMVKQPNLKSEKMKDVIYGEDMVMEDMESGYGISPGSVWKQFGVKESEGGGVSEGRVHGGSLIHLLGGSSSHKNSSSSSNLTTEKYHVMPTNWM